MGCRGWYGGLWDRRCGGGFRVGNMRKCWWRDQSCGCPVPLQFIAESCSSEKPTSPLIVLVYTEIK